MPRTATGCTVCNLFGGEVPAGYISRTRANAQAGGAASGDVCGLAARVLTFGWSAEMFTHVITAFTAGCLWTSVCGSAPGTPAFGGPVLGWAQRWDRRSANKPIILPGLYQF